MDEISTQELLQEIKVLPAEQRMLIAEYMLESLHPADSEVEEAWQDKVARRMKAVGQGQSTIIPSEELHGALYHLMKGKGHC